MVMAGRHPSSSERMLRQIVPEGYTFGWKRGGSNLPIKMVKKNCEYWEEHTREESNDEINM
jgi:hypothetical protein